MEYKTDLWIQTSNDAEMISAMEWIRDNHGVRVVEARAIGTSKAITLSLNDANFNDAIATVTSFKTQFAAQLTDYEMIMTQ